VRSAHRRQPGTSGTQPLEAPSIQGIVTAHAPTEAAAPAPSDRTSTLVPNGSAVPHTL
jgi:hypothetical protein